MKKLILLLALVASLVAVSAGSVVWGDSAQAVVPNMPVDDGGTGTNVCKDKYGVPFNPGQRYTQLGVPAHFPGGYPGSGQEADYYGYAYMYIYTNSSYQYPYQYDFGPICLYNTAVGKSVWHHWSG